MYFFRFCVVIKKENYPDQQPAKTVAGGTKQIYRQPGHTIYLLPTLVLANLLPCDLNYYIKGTSIKGTMNPGKEAVLHAADTSQNIELGELEYMISYHIFNIKAALLIPISVYTKLHEFAICSQVCSWRTFLCVRSCLSLPVHKTMWCACGYMTSTNSCSVSPYGLFSEPKEH